MAASGAFAGRNGRLYVSSDNFVSSNVLLGCIENDTFDGSKDMLDSTCKEDGAYRTSIDGHKSGSTDITGRRDQSDAGQQLVIDAFEGNSQLWVRFRARGDTSGDKQRQFEVGVPSWTEDGPLDDVSGYSCTLEARGSFAESSIP